MMDWQVGDLALCVDARENPLFENPISLKEGAAYTVREVLPPYYWYLNGAVCTGIEVEGHSSGSPWGFAAERFRKIRPDEREACEPEFVTLLKRSKQKEPA